MMGNARSIGGFTLVELLVGLLVTSILLSAIATLAFAFSTADAASGDTAGKQARVRQTIVQLCELLRHCRLVCATPGTDLVVWRADDNGDNEINAGELVYIERGSASDKLQLAELRVTDNLPYTLAELALSETKAQLGSEWQYAPLIPDCNNVQFDFHGVAPPETQLLTVSFDLVENDMVRPYQVTVSLRAWAGHLLSDANEIVTQDDD
jgi:prepilin-type N-terminal cleavage/methylation domain-containing protein